MKNLLFALLCAFMASCVIAEDITMTVSDVKDTSSITNFNICGSTSYPIVGANNYYIACTLRTPNASVVNFEGKSLHVGKGAALGAMAICRSSNATQTFTAKNDGFFIEKGRIVPYGNRITMVFSGDVTVLNKTAKNFYIGSDGVNNWGLATRFDGNLIGDKDAWLGFRSVASNNVVQLAGYTSWENYQGTAEIFNSLASDFPISAEYRNGWNMPGKLVIGTGHYLYPQYGTSRATIGSLELKDGSVIGGRSGSNSYAWLTVTNNLVLGQNITFRYNSTINAGNDYEIPFLVKAASATGDLDTSKFTEKTHDTLAHECLPRFWFETKTDAEGNETLYYRQHKVVHIKGNDDNTYNEGNIGSCLTNAIRYQDGKLPHSRADYVVTKSPFAGTTAASWNGWRVLTPGADGLENGTYTFGGESLTIGTNCTFKSMATVLNIKSLRLMGDATFIPRIGNATPSTFNGNEIFVGPETAGGLGATIQAYFGLAWTCNAALTGSGLLEFVANDGSSNPGATVILTKPSNEFFGRIRITSTGMSKTSATKNERVQITAANQLGAPLATFTADALALDSWGTLEAVEDVDFSTANRGVTIGDVAQMRVVEGKTLTIGNKITFGGTLHKVGAGRLVLNAPSVMTTEANLVIDEGSVMVNNDKSLENVAVTCAAGSALAVDAASTSKTGAILGAGTGNLTIDLVYPESATDKSIENIVLCTIPEGANVMVKRPKGYAVKLTSKPNGNGMVVYSASVARTGVIVVFR